MSSRDRPLPALRRVSVLHMEGFWALKTQERSESVEMGGGCHRKPPKEGMSMLGCEGSTEATRRGVWVRQKGAARQWKGGAQTGAPGFCLSGLAQLLAGQTAES